MSQDKVLAAKISPSILIGRKVEISSRDFKPKKSPPKKSEDCQTKFWEYTAKDNTDITLLKDYLDTNYCEDIVSSDMLETEDLKNDVTLNDIVLSREKDTLKGTSFLIYAVENNLKNKEKLINKTGRHKATKYVANDLTICYLELEDSNIFRSGLIDKYRAAKLTQKPNENGYLKIN